MNEFKQLIIENFQSHQHTVIDFSQGLNVFVGPSDSGKSAILRALRWLLFNTPRGAEFIRTGAKECRVTLTFQDGAQVVRMRGTSVNRYVLRTAEGEEHIFEGFGNEIPQEITDMHGIQALKLDGKEVVVHLGTQLESPFLLFETAGNKAKTIGRVSGAHIIDKAFKKTTNDRQNTNLELKRLEQETEELTEKLKPYANLEVIEQQLDDVQGAFFKAKKAFEISAQLQNIKNNLLSIAQEKEEYGKWLKQKENILFVDRVLSDTERKIQIVNQLIRLHRKWESVQQEKQIAKMQLSQKHHVFMTDEKLEKVTQKQQQLVKMRQLKEKLIWVLQEKEVHHTLLSKASEMGAVDQTVKKLEQTVRKVALLSSIRLRWEDVKARVLRGRQFQKEKETEIALLIQKWAQALKNLKKCPTCGSEIHSSVMEHIIQEYQGGDSYVAAGREYPTD